MSIIKNKKKEKYHKIALLAKSKLNSMEDLIYETLIGYSISHGEYVSVNNARKDIQNVQRSSKCSVFNSKNSKFLKEKEARGLLSVLEIRIPLSQIPLLGPVLF